MKRFEKIQKQIESANQLKLEQGKCGRLRRTAPQKCRLAGKSTSKGHEVSKEKLAHGQETGEAKISGESPRNGRGGVGTHVYISDEVDIEKPRKLFGKESTLAKLQFIKL